ncbi:putative signal peptide protein [Puccinia sorghi]|uniref:Putative signal peptide protein n=1 Tax=Puccinia sorghi TaxID=27349 RepID=A0A0L6VCW3_9BASI|nr:putative signal peptide protein [Puccinia sorghi]
MFLVSMAALLTAHPTDIIYISTQILKKQILRSKRLLPLTGTSATNNKTSPTYSKVEITGKTKNFTQIWVNTLIPSNIGTNKKEKMCKTTSNIWSHFGATGEGMMFYFSLSKAKEACKLLIMSKNYECQELQYHLWCHIDMYATKSRGGMPFGGIFLNFYKIFISYFIHVSQVSKIFLLFYIQKVKTLMLFISILHILYQWQNLHLIRCITRPKVKAMCKNCLARYKGAPLCLMRQCAYVAFVFGLVHGTTSTFHQRKLDRIKSYIHSTWLFSPAITPHLLALLLAHFSYLRISSSQKINNSLLTSVVGGTPYKLLVIIYLFFQNLFRGIYKYNLLHILQHWQINYSHI